MSNINITLPALKEFLISPKTEKNNNMFTSALKHNINGIDVDDSTNILFGAHNGCKK